MSGKLTLGVRRIDASFADIPLPSYQTEGSSGMDVRAAVEEPMTIGAGKVGLVPTNLALEIPEGYELQVRPRSGLAIKKGIGLLNAPGTIDEDYRGELKVILFNFSDEDFVINRGDRIAQLIMAKVWKADIVEKDELSDSARGEGGFGHTGTK